MQRRGEVPRLDEVVTGVSAAATSPKRWPELTASECVTAADFSYVDGVLADGATVKLCRLRYTGSAHSGASRSTAPATTTTKNPILPTGLPVGTCEDALDTACGLYLGDPTAWN